MKISEYLYHYTSIDTLELILKNRTIRFNSLNNVDDKEEKFTEDLSDFGKYIFVSCWSKDFEENKDLWDRYGKGGTGVRLKMCKYPFKRYYISGPDVKNPYWSYSKSFFYNAHMVLLFGADYKEQPMLKKVMYTDDEKLIFPKLVYGNEYNTSCILNKVGIYKRNKWDVQREWRYSFPIVPISEFELRIKGTQAIWESIVSGRNLGISYYDLELDEKSLKNIEVLMGPMTSKSDIDRVLSIAKECNIKIKINKSNLKL